MSFDVVVVGFGVGAILDWLVLGGLLASPKFRKWAMDKIKLLWKFR